MHRPDGGVLPKEIPHALLYGPIIFKVFRLAPQFRVSCMMSHSPL